MKEKPLSKGEECLMLLVLLFVLGSSSLFLQQILKEQVSYYAFDLDYYQKETFRQLHLSTDNLQKIREYIKKSSVSTGEMIAVMMLEHEFELQKTEISKEMLLEASDRIRFWKHYHLKEWKEMAEVYEALFGEKKSFPAMDSTSRFSYGDSWMMERTYGGSRGHEGCDIFPEENIRGKYQIRAAEDGVIEKIGWLPLGGYRIGIRTRTGCYHYYAHMESYAEEMAEGREVKRGELLGFMGDSGYGEEGTVGQFDVHLHFGIYLSIRGEEISINPYWVLKDAELRDDSV